MRVNDTYHKFPHQQMFIPKHTSKTSQKLTPSAYPDIHYAHMHDSLIARSARSLRKPKRAASPSVWRVQSQSRQLHPKIHSCLDLRVFKRLSHTNRVDLQRHAHDRAARAMYRFRSDSENYLLVKRLETKLISG
jgi:hypothetical protein